MILRTAYIVFFNKETKEYEPIEVMVTPENLTKFQDASWYKKEYVNVTKHISVEEREEDKKTIEKYFE